MVNVSGQITTFPIAYAPPNLTMLDPAFAATAGDTNLTLYGHNFGTGSDFSIRFSGRNDNADDDDYLWEYLVGTDNDDDDSGTVFSLDHERIKFASPEGQQEQVINVSLTVSGQTSNVLSFNFESPVITFLADPDDTSAALGSNCMRYSADGCGLTTDGGYTVAIMGENFGVSGQTVYFDGAALDSSDVTYVSHTEMEFTVPQGVGKNLEVYVVVGTLTSNTVYFDYDPPFITQISPNEPDASGETMEICESC